MNKALEASLYTQATDWKKAVKEAAAMLAQLIKEKEEADKALNKAVKALDVAFTARHEVRRETAQLLEARNEYVDRNPDRATIALDAYEALSKQRDAYQGFDDNWLQAARHFAAAVESAIPYEANLRVFRTLIDSTYLKQDAVEQRVDAASKNVEEKQATLQNLESAIATQEEWSRAAKNNALVMARGAMQEAQRKQAALSEMLKECGQKETEIQEEQGSGRVVCARCGCKTCNYYNVQQRVGDGGANWCAECMGRT